MSLSHDEGYSIPFDSPFYPSLPAHYRDVAFQFVFFRADPKAVGRLLPKPLAPDPGGLCIAMGIRVPFCTSYGAFHEAVLEERCSFRGQPGWYCSHVWHDGPRGIAAGREIYGTPKVYADVEVEIVERVMHTRAALAGTRVVAISSTMEEPVAIEAVPRLTPAWRLKMIPRADGPGVALKQLVDCTAATRDYVAHQCFRGRGVVQFAPSPLCDMTGLEAQEYGDAFFVEASYTETYGTIAYDYLTGPSRQRARPKD